MSTVGIKELKNRLTHYLRLTQKGEEVIVTDRGKPFAVIHQSNSDQLVLTREGRLATLAAQGKICFSNWSASPPYWCLPIVSCFRPPQPRT